MRSQFLGLAISLLTINHAAIAQTEESPSSQPPAELDRLEYFVGKWRCQQPAAPETPVGIFIWTVERDLNDFWYVGNAEEIDVPDERKPINSREFLGYDLALKKLFRFVVVGNGSSYNFTASDWQEGKLIWSGSVIDREKIRQVKQEIIQNDEDRFTTTYFIKDEGEKWQPVVNESCERQN